VGTKCKALLSIFNRPDLLTDQEPDNSQWDVVSATESEPSVDERHSDVDESVDSFFGDLIFYHLNSCHPATGDPFNAIKYANELGVIRPYYQQYTIYLFARILLCCKDLNPNKSKDKLMGAQKDKKDKKDKNSRKEPNKNVKLQLKGRIFMTNVTEVLSIAKAGTFQFILFLTV